MSAPILYNDNDPRCSHWLRFLIAQGLLPEGTIDERSIGNLDANNLVGFIQCHFFAGIGGWPYALQLAGWPADRPVWTGSCPCQPFSVAGKRKGFADPRHLWPEFFRLIQECRPSIVFGEQVASKAGRTWLSRVQLDLEGLGYAVGAADLCAAGVGAPHIRQRLYWVADRFSAGLEEWEKQPAWQECPPLERNGHVGGVADSSESQRSGMLKSFSPIPKSFPQESRRRGWISGLENSTGRNDRAFHGESKPGDGRQAPPEGPSFWDNVEYLLCEDGKVRLTQRGLRVLAKGVPGRVAQLRGLGNAIVPQVAAEFIKAYLDILPAILAPAD